MNWKVECTFFSATTSWMCVALSMVALGVLMTTCCLHTSCNRGKPPNMYPLIGWLSGCRFINCRIVISQRQLAALLATTLGSFRTMMSATPPFSLMHRVNPDYS
ncbi:hypothetical protein LINGRAHAP2_LOCUS13803 [Linum grandiflorum]